MDENTLRRVRVELESMLKTLAENYSEWDDAYDEGWHACHDEILRRLDALAQSAGASSRSVRNCGESSDAPPSP